MPALVNALRDQGVAAVLDRNLSYEYSPATSPSELYAAVTPDGQRDVNWFLTGTVTRPQIPSEFLASWWAESRSGDIKMATTIPLIYFDFSSSVSFHTSRENPIGKLIGSNTIATFPLSFRGQFASGDMRVTVKP